MACGIYITYAIALAHNRDRGAAYDEMRALVSRVYAAEPYRGDLTCFSRILSGAIPELDEDAIGSGGYVVDTLEAALWCLFTNESYANTVLAAVNLGEDTDTTGAVAGGLAGVLYGYDAIPDEWVDVIVLRDKIDALAGRFQHLLG